MRIIDEGHQYLLKSNGTDHHSVVLKFYKDPEHNDGKGFEGTTNQEVLRALIDRMKFLDNQKPHATNKLIIQHLRDALTLHEVRHLDRLMEENFPVEMIDPYPIKGNDHWTPNKSLWDGEL